jgi:hypothetical protein
LFAQVEGTSGMRFPPPCCKQNKSQILSDL